MKSFPHIISKLLYEPLVLTPKKHAVFCGVVEAALAGRMQPPEMPMPMPDPEEDDKPDMEQKEDTAIIAVHGTLFRHGEDFMSGGCSLDDVHEAMDLAEHDPSVTRVLFDFRTPGGEVTGVPEAARRIRNFPKETISFSDSECCSGGMWLASQCDRFYATPSATLGSIGVWTAYLDLSRQMANDGENMQAIFAGKYKLMGAYWKALTEEEKGILQSQVDKIYGQFKAAVRMVREVTTEAMGSGLCFDGEEAAERGLTDGTVEKLEDILEGMVE